MDIKEIKNWKEIRDKIAQGLVYMCDSEIKDQWKCSEAHADIIINDVIRPLLSQQLDEIDRLIEKDKRGIRHPSLRNENGEICDACSEDFTYNKALSDCQQLLKQLRDTKI